MIRVSKDRLDRHGYPSVFRGQYVWVCTYYEYNPVTRRYVNKPADQVQNCAFFTLHDWYKRLADRDQSIAGSLKALRDKKGRSAGGGALQIFGRSEVEPARPRQPTEAGAAAASGGGDEEDEWGLLEALLQALEEEQRQVAAVVVVA